MRSNVQSQFGLQYLLFLACRGISDSLYLILDLLTHEAHRHPYLERLGAMYMMKLRHGEYFGKKAGTSWRLLFVFALMPWLRKYRIHADGNDDTSNFAFSKDGRIYQRFVKNKALGYTDRRLSSCPRACDGGPPSDVQQLKEENDSLNAKVKELEREVAELSSKVSSLMLVPIQ